MRRHLTLVALVVLLVTAGCLSVGESPDGEPIAGSATATNATASPTTTAASAPRTATGPRATVVDVVDGDTVRVRFENGTRETVRLLGVDTPEVHGSNTPDEYEGVPDTDAGAACLGRAGEDASAYAKERLASRQVTLGFDEQAGRRGYYGRLLAYVYVDGEDFNYALLTEGHARLYESRFRERDRYATAERAAREDGRGLWSCAVSTTPSGSGSLVVADVHADAAGNDNENLDDEYVSFRNDGDTTLDLGGWTVSDAAGATYTFPAGTTLDPGETLTLYTGRGTDTATTRYWNRDGAVWNNGGDTVTVRRGDGTLVVERSY